MNVEQLNRAEIEAQIRYATEALALLKQRFEGRPLPMHMEEFRRAVEAQLAYANRLCAEC